MPDAEPAESFGGGGGGRDGSDGSCGRARSPDDHDHGDFFSSSNGDGGLVRGNGADFGGGESLRPRSFSSPGSADRRNPEEFGGDAGAMRCGGRKSENDALRFLCPRLRVEVEVV